MRACVYACTSSYMCVRIIYTRVCLLHFIYFNWSFFYFYFITFPISSFKKKNMIICWCFLCHNFNVWLTDDLALSFRRFVNPSGSFIPRYTARPILFVSFLLNFKSGFRIFSGGFFRCLMSFLLYELKEKVLKKRK